VLRIGVRREVRMITIGVDAHKRAHMAVAVDAV